MGTSASNALVTLLHRDVILQVIQEQKKLKQSDVDEEETRVVKRLERVESLLVDNVWPLTACRLGINTMMLNCITQKMGKFEQNDQTVTQKKETLRSIYCLYEQLLKTDDSFGELRKMAVNIVNQDFQDELNVVDQLLHKVSDFDKKSLSEQVQVAARNAFKKLKKDQDSIFQLADSEDLLLTTNRRSESVFSTYKGLEKNFVGMTQERLEVLTRARINKVLLFS